MLVYPGDDLYPKGDFGYYDSDHDVDKFKDKSYDEAAEGCKNFCRIEMKDYYARRLMCNINDGLLPAVSEKPMGKI